MPMRQRGRKPGAIHDDTPTIHELVRTGASITAIARNYSVSRMTIHRILGPRADRFQTDTLLRLMQMLYIEPGLIDDPPFRSQMRQAIQAIAPHWHPPDERR